MEPSNAPAVSSASSPGPIPGAPAGPAGGWILAVVDRAARDPLLDEYVAVMERRGWPCAVLEVDDTSPHAVRDAIRAHALVTSGTARGIQIFGTTLPSFRIRYFYPGTTLDSRGATDLPFGSDHPFFSTPFAPGDATRHPAWDVAGLVAALEGAGPDYVQAQWVARIFHLDAEYLGRLANHAAPVVNELFVVNSDPVFKEADLNQRIRDRYHARYGGIGTGQKLRFGFLGVDFEEHRLMEYLGANMGAAGFLSVADHGTSNKLVNLPPSQNGMPQLPRLPAVVEFAACEAGDWMEEELPSISLVEAALRRGCLTAIAAQCLLAWNFARGHDDPNPGTDRYDADNQNPAPMLDTWPRTNCLGRSQAEAVGGALALLKTSVYNDKANVAFQVLGAHGLFGDGTMAFAQSSFA